MKHQKRVSIVHTTLVKEKTILYGKRHINTSEEAADFAASFFYAKDKEAFYVCCMDAKNEPVSMELVALGGRDFATVDMPMVFKNAILSNAKKNNMFPQSSQWKL